MASKETTKYLTAMSLVEKIRKTCNKTLIKETSRGNSSVFSLVEDSVELEIDHSTGLLLVEINHPLIKERIQFQIKDTDVLVGSSYVELYESSARFIHLDFDLNNTKRNKDIIASRAKAISIDSKPTPKVDTKVKPRKTGVLF